MKKINIWLLAGLLGVTVPLSIQAAEDAHGDHDGHEAEQSGGHADHDDHASEQGGGHADHDDHEAEKSGGHEDHDGHESEQGGGHGGHGGGGHGGHEEEESGVNLTPEQQKMAGVVIEVLQLQDIANEIRAPGEVQLNAYATTRVAPRIAAQVVERKARLGDSVKKGRALVVLSSVEMAQAQGDLLVAEREWRRVSKLGRDVVSEQRYTEARVARDQARARVSAYGMTGNDIKQLVDSSKAELANGRFQLLASQDGTVIRDDFIVGELVEAGRVLFEVSDESVLWVEAKLPPSEAAQIKVNASAVMELGGHQIEGRVTQVHHALDESTRTLGVRIEIPNPEDRLHPGLFVEARIQGTSFEQALAVPNNALMRSPDGDWQVFVEHEPGEFEPQEVDVIRTTANFTVIGGIKPGARVAIKGAFFLQSELAKSGFAVHNH